MPTDADAKSARLRSAYEQLSVAAAALNQASDELGASVAALDDALSKLNLGVRTWVNFDVDDQGHYWNGSRIGYQKVGNKWGISLCLFSGNVSDDCEEITGPWLFNDAPRELRIKGVDLIPELIEGLIKSANDAAVAVAEKAKVAADLAQAIGNVADKPERPNAVRVLKRTRLGEKQ